MYSFLVLGILPGTNFQITFDMWLEIVVGLAAAVITVWIASAIIDFYRFTDELLYVPNRVLLPATQLHQRVR